MITAFHKSRLGAARDGEYTPNWFIRWPWLWTSVLGVCMALLALAMLSQERAKQLEAERYQLLQLLSMRASALEGAIQTGVVALENIRSELVLHPDYDPTELDARVALFLGHYPHFRHIAVAPDLVIRYIYPTKGNEAALGLDYRTVPAQYRAVETAINKRSAVVAGPVNLVQGGTGLVIRVPVILPDQQVWGVIAAIIPMEPLLQQAGLAELQRDYFLGLSGKDGDESQTELFWGDIELQRDLAVTSPIKLPVGRWLLHAYPRHSESWRDSNLQLLALVAFTIIFLVCAAVLLFLRLIGERERALHTLAFQASFDPVTRLPNRSVFNEQLTSAMKRAQAEQSSLSLFCLDLDEFKQVNESLGHQVGDELLKAVAIRLNALVQPQDIVARLGGDEFAVLRFIDPNAESTEQFAERIVAEFHQPLDISGRAISISCSIGIALYPLDGLTAIDLLKHADRATYAAKEIGRNTYHFYDAAMQKEADRFVLLHHEILKGLELNQFFLVYQPIYDVNTGKFTKCEALVRWQHPERGLISPLDFIAVAERTGAIRPLGHFVLKQALADSQLFRRQGLELQISINRSSQEFNVHHVAQEWLQSIQQAGLEYNSIIFEITESLFMDRISVQQNNILALHSEGVQLAIDDFGTGYSALNYLSRYPVNFIKIDKSFVNDVDVQERARALVAVLINMAKVLDVQVVAEGVETAGQLAVLQELGCDFIQGYYFSKPLKLEEFVKFLQQKV